jgi:hypothetical protein
MPENNRLLPEERYHRDAQFKALVDLMQAMIGAAQYTPTEIREAALLAAVRHAELSVRPMYIERGTNRPLWRDDDGRFHYADESAPPPEMRPGPPPRAFWEPARRREGDEDGKK